MRFVAAGDMIIQQRICQDFPGYAELAPFIQQADARFFNLETTLNREGEANGNQFSGGTYLRTDPRVLEDIQKFGFNMTTFNNNHALDYFYTGFQRTLDALNESDFVHSGCGNNLAEASAPRYLETKNGRVALISVCSSFHPAAMAGQQSPRVPGRPGVNGLSVYSYMELPQEDLAVIRRIADQSNINAATDINRKEGYAQPLPEDQAELGGMRFCLGERPQNVMKFVEKDMQRIENAIYEAQLQADYILISIHSHQISGTEKENPAEFLKEFAHRCIDAGAHAVIGHGPHLLRPIEVYKERPIFYSLGDFALQLYSVEFGPEDFFAQQGMSAYNSTIHDLLKKRSKDFTVGLMTDRRMFISVIPQWEMEDGKLTKLELMPIEMKMGGNKSEIGLPRRSSDPQIAEYLAKMCQPYGTKLEMTQEGMIRCTW